MNLDETPACHHPAGRTRGARIPNGLYPPADSGDGVLVRGSQRFGGHLDGATNGDQWVAGTGREDDRLLGRGA